MVEGLQSIVLHDLLRIAEQPERYDWQPFHAGIDIHRLYGGAGEGPAAALLRYRPGAQVPAHLHQGWEHILVLAGSQADEHGVYPAGSLLTNPPGSSHSVTSAQGCIVLAIWERPVCFL